MHKSEMLLSAPKFAYEYTLQFQAQLATDDAIRTGLPVSDSEGLVGHGTTEIPAPLRAPLIGGSAQDHKNISVGIIGAGAAGLYTAMILDSLGISYEILESSDRAGGRIYTHEFSEGEWDYFDVGAMRLPEIPIMYRVFNLIKKRLNLSYTLIPYHNTDLKNNQILKFNSVRLRKRDVEPQGEDDEQIDHFMDSDRHGGPVPNEYVSRGPQYWLDECLGPFRKVFSSSGWRAGFDFVMKYDQYSVRSFMQTAIHDPPIEKEAYPGLAINWIERMSSETGSFDLALSEMVVANLIFDYPTDGLATCGFDDPSCGSKQWKWFTLAGGAKVMIEAMMKKIKFQPQMCRRVTSISPTSSYTADLEERTETEQTYICCKPMKVTTTDCQGRQAISRYDYVISTIPLSNLRLVNIEDCNPTYLQRESIRMLEYTASCKVGMKFKTRWWQDLKHIDIFGGQSKTDTLVRTVVYPSHGVMDSKADAVMIASYTLGQDAHRLGGLIHGHDTIEEKILIDAILADLSAIHLVPLSFLREQLVDFFSFNWQSHPHSIGAYAHFAPTQFKQIYPALTQPAAAGRLIFAGDSLNWQRGWIEGALNSADYAVRSLLRCGQYSDLLERMDAEWADEGLTKAEAEKWGELMDKQALYGSLLSAGIRAGGGPGDTWEFIGRRNEHAIETVSVNV